MPKRLYRSRSDRVVAGVCGGLATYFDIDPTIVRVIAVLSVFVSGLGILAYIILAIVVPLENTKETEPKDVIKENVEEIKETAGELGREIRSTFVGEKDESEEIAKARRRRRNLFGIIIIVLGVLLLLGSLNIFWWFRWGILWPLIIVAIGVLIILGTRRK